MIGNKIVINNQEWEEIDSDEYLQLEDGFMNIYIGDKMKDKTTYYKKAQKEVFPKVFEGKYFKYSVKDEIDVLNIKRGDIELDFSEGTLLLDEVEIEALKQALAFRDDLIRRKNKYDKL